MIDFTLPPYIFSIFSMNTIFLGMDTLSYKLMQAAYIGNHEFVMLNNEFLILEQQLRSLE